MAEKSIQYLNAIFWNKFDSKMRKISSLDIFKRSIKKMSSEFYSAAEPHNHHPCTEIEKPCICVFMVIMAIGMARGRVPFTYVHTYVRTKSSNIAVILQK